ncbi:DUF2891 domain-containing protein [Aquidulcibacter paucihalophilus]|uniref:DUF2891 domain-containing protein n=1 Tax=Aquidulcibacter paucihalophilus TaxID=1978549 RepID=UPI000A18AEDA
MRLSLLPILALCFATMNSMFANASGFEEATSKFANLALSCIHTEYPNKIAHVLNSAEDAKTPSQLTPAFYGCFDHHSSVHGHWLLARLARLYPQASYAPAARQALTKSLTKANLEVELAYMNAPGRAGFERPYGLAWMLQLGAELRQWAKQDASVATWAADFAPLEQRAAGQFKSWLPKLRTPMRVGEHSQTAFALGLARDWAVEVQDTDFLALIDERAMTYYGNDRDCPLRFEPGGEDFVSACLGEADLMRRVLPPKAYAKWLSVALPTIPNTGTSDWLPVGIVTDRTDGKLAHTDGLNLSRAWMLEGMASGLPASDKRRLALLAAAKAHRDIALPAVTGEHYEGGHWLGTFATYLVTQRGLTAGQ